MVSLRVGAACINQTPFDWDGNIARLSAAITRAKSDGVGLLCTPELCLSGYGCEDQFFSQALHTEAQQALSELLAVTKGIIVAVGMPLQLSSGIYDAACFIADGSIKGIVCKQFLAREGIHYEPRWFKPWPAGDVCSVSICGSEVPVGDLLFDCGGIRVGFEICEDAWAARRPGIRLAQHSVDIILNPSASHFAFGKNEIRKRFVLEGSRAFGVCYVYANVLGNEAGRAIYDGNCFIARHGEMLASGARFSFEDFQLTAETIDIEDLRLSRMRTHSFEGVDRLESSLPPPRIITVQHCFGTNPPTAKQKAKAAWEDSNRLKEEEFARAVALALFDYMRKSHSRGFAVSISGGADSAACACLVALMVQFGAAELGLAAFSKKCGVGNALESVKSPQELIGRLLTCVFQATKNNSSATHNAARTVSQAIGARFVEFRVDELVQLYEETVSKALGITLGWEQHDIVRQNIQARARSPGVWMIANIEGFLLLATSNRSEAAVGYTTMDGDTSGSLSPIAGVDKAFLRRWLVWLEKEGPLGLKPIPALASITSQEPTAELRPLERRQTDEADLMPYEVLDAIERAAIRDKQGPLEVWKRIRSEFGQYSSEDTKMWVIRFFTLWCRNQWKRERYAPCFHLDDENLDPKTWCRFPILSGGFERELRRLKAA